MFTKKQLLLASIGLTLSISLLVILILHARNVQQTALRAEGIQRLSKMREEYRQNPQTKSDVDQQHVSPLTIAEQATNVTETAESDQSQTKMTFQTPVLPESADKIMTGQESPKRRAQRLDLAKRMQENNTLINSVSQLLLDNGDNHLQLMRSIYKLETSPEKRRAEYREALRHYPADEVEPFFERVENAPDMTIEQIKAAQRNNKINRETINMMSDVLREEAKQLLQEF